MKRIADNEELILILEKTKEDQPLIIVEGHKDRKALESLGFENVLAINKIPLFKVVETVAHRYKECLILTDLDSEGKKLYGKLNSALSERGVHIDNKLRHFLFKNTELRQIEGLPNYLKRKDKRFDDGF